MELRDVIVAPLLLIMVLSAAYFARPYLTDGVTRKYFFPALLVKVIGALALGIVYQYYYPGGDTFNYHTYGSRVIWNAMMEDPGAGLRLIFSHDNSLDPSLFKYTSRILFMNDPSSYFVVRIAAFLDLFTFSSYAGTAILFAAISFVGMWLLFQTFYQQFPHLHKWIAISIFFIPSVFFWGSGILKDTIVLASLGAATFEIKSIFIDKRIRLRSILLLLGCFFIIFNVRIFILMCFLPASLFWVVAENLSELRSVVLKALLVPFILCFVALSGYFAVKKIGENDPKYSLDRLARTSRITAYDIGFYTGRDAGSGYSLGELDDSFISMLRLGPQAINVSLFRPYLWEVKNPLMLLSAIESMLMLAITLYLLVKVNLNIFKVLNDPGILFCLIFSITFAFAVGVSTFNFGTLARYKIPLIPYYLIGLTLVAEPSKRDRKLAMLETTE